MNDLLALLGKRVHELRVAKNWSQEEFAHVSGLHRTYVGQVERGEKNISFGNLVKISGVLGVTLSELLSGLEENTWTDAKHPGTSSGVKRVTGLRPDFEIQKLLRRLRLQRTAMERTMDMLEERVAGVSSHRQKKRGRS